MVERRTGGLGGATGGEGDAGAEGRRTDTVMIEGEKPFVVNRQEDPKDPLETRQKQVLMRHPQLKPETWRLCWKMDQVLKGRGKDDT